MAGHLLLALWPEDDTRSALAARASDVFRRFRPPGARLAPERYHLPLHSLGVHAQQPGALRMQLSEALASLRVPAFDLCLDRAAGLRCGQAVPWALAPAQPAAELRHLWRVLRDILRERALPYRSGMPLTAQVLLSEDARQVLLTTPVAAVTWPVRRVALLWVRTGEEPASLAVEVLENWHLVTEARASAARVQRDLWDT